MNKELQWRTWKNKALKRQDRSDQEKNVGSTWSERKLKVDKSWKQDVNSQKKKKKKPVNKLPPKSLDDLDKEMDDYFKAEKE